MKHKLSSKGGKKVTMVQLSFKMLSCHTTNFLLLLLTQKGDQEKSQIKQTKKYTKIIQ